MTDDRRGRVYAVGPPKERLDNADQDLLAPCDPAFVDSDPWRALRILGEFVEGFDTLARVDEAVAVFGSARLQPGNSYYDAAVKVGREFADRNVAVITGGRPGIMEAANRGASEAGGLSIGCNIELPHEQGTNEYVNLAVDFRYFFRATMVAEGALDEEELTLFALTDDPVEACELVIQGAR